MKTTPYQKCPICDGHGNVINTNFTVNSTNVIKCKRCNGTGTIPEYVISDFDNSSGSFNIVKLNKADGVSATFHVSDLDIKVHCTDTRIFDKLVKMIDNEISNINNDKYRMENGKPIIDSNYEDKEFVLKDGVTFIGNFIQPDINSSVAYEFKVNIVESERRGNLIAQTFTIGAIPAKYEGNAVRHFILKFTTLKSLT
jgi:hypothetical protein